MSKLLPTLSIFVIFLISVGAYRLCKKTTPPSLCEIIRNPDKFHNQTVEFKVWLYSDLGGPYLFEPSCQDLYIFPLLDLSNFKNAPDEIQNWVKNIGEIDKPGEKLWVEATIAGKFDKDHRPDSDRLSSPHKYKIIPTKIEQNSPLQPRSLF